MWLMPSFQRTSIASTNSTKNNLKQGSDFTVVAMGTKCIVSNLHWKYELNMTEDKEVL